MSAELLRQAATILRERAEKATPGPWHVDEVGDIDDKSAVLEVARWRGYTNTVNLGEDRPTADYIATVHPGVGLALADWLDSTASTMQHVIDDLSAIEGQPTIDQLVGYDFVEALDVAHLIVGGDA